MIVISSALCDLLGKRKEKIQMLMLKDLLHEEWLIWGKLDNDIYCFIAGERSEMIPGCLLIEGLWDSFKLKTCQSIVFLLESYVQK